MTEVLYLEKADKYAEAAAAAHRAAERWGDPDIWRAGRYELPTSESFLDSRTCAREALGSAPAMWGGQGTCAPAAI